MTAPEGLTAYTGWYRSGARRRASTTSSVTLDDARRMSNSAWVTSSRLMTGLLLYTGLGWLLSRWLGHEAVLMAVGAMVGLGLSFYLMFASLAHEAKQDERRRAEGERG